MEGNILEFVPQKSKANCNERATQQIIGREGETATFIWRCVVNFSLSIFGFAPRQLRRWVLFWLYLARGIL